jgi:hypothetical protein
MTFSITNSRNRTHIAGLSMAAAALLCSPFVCAEEGNSANAKARYEQERSRCLSGQSGQDQKTCLREAGAALQASRQGQLDDHGARYTRNALERCKPLPSDEAKDCRDRILGQGSVSGSVKGGGLYREKATTEVHVLPPVDTTQPPPPAPQGFQPLPPPPPMPPAPVN